MLFRQRMGLAIAAGLRISSGKGNTGLDGEGALILIVKSVTRRLRHSSNILMNVTMLKIIPNGRDLMGVLC